MLIGNRIVVLDVGGKEFYGNDINQGLRIVFETSAEIGGIKKAKFQVYGLLKETYQAFKAEDEVTFTLKSGFSDDSAKASLFSGFLYNMEQRREGPEFIVTLHCWSLGKGSDEDSTETLEENTDGSQGIILITKLFKSLHKLNVVRVSTKAQDIVNSHRFKSGGQWNGRPMSIIRGIADDLGLSLVVDDRELYLFKKDDNDPRSETITYVSSARGNLIGTPSVGLLEAYRRTEVSVSLDPNIIAASLVDVQSEYFSLSGDNLSTISTNISGASGLYMVFTVTNRGDTHGETWASNLSIRDYTKGSSSE